MSKFYNTELVYDYNMLKPFNFLNFSFLEATLYNLNIYSGKQLNINLKLDSYLKRSVCKGIPVVRCGLIPRHKKGLRLMKDSLRNNSLLELKSTRFKEQKLQTR
jgi:hypothetical protein